MKIFILGANGFIGHHLTKAILEKTDWKITALDCVDHRMQSFFSHPHFKFHLGDMRVEKNWVKNQIQKSDIVIPLAAIATPMTYVQEPLRVFELDFEANLEIVRFCAEFSKRLIFPSTSEVYGMCPDAAFDEEESALVTGPIHKTRWIYSASKQLLDRIIYAYGQKGLSYTLFRPFNWYGPGLDSVHETKARGARVITQFIGNILRGEQIQLVNGGNQRRCFTYIEDGISALLKMIENKNAAAERKIFNIGNPYENVSIRQLAEMLMESASKKVTFVEVPAEEYYGVGYQDINFRVPSIQRVI